jgi:hypothetical protein
MMNNSKLIITHGGTIGVDAYSGTKEEAEILLMALSSFGFLLKGPDFYVHRCTFGAFADAIESNYSLENTKTSQSVNTLRSLHERNC